MFRTLIEAGQFHWLPLAGQVVYARQDQGLFGRNAHAGRSGWSSEVSFLQLTIQKPETKSISLSLSASKILVAT